MRASAGGSSQSASLPVTDAPEAASADADADATRRPSRFAALVLGSTVALTAAAVVLLALRVPTVQRLTLWFWLFRDTPLSVPIMAVLVAALGAMIAILRRPPQRSLVRTVLPFFAFGLVIQYGVAFAEMRGIQGIRDRFLRSGHVQFAHIAVFEPDLWDVLRDYDAFTTKPNMIFARSKPPGAVVVYILIDRAATHLPEALAHYAPEPDIPPVLLKTANMAVVLFPVLAALALLPLAALARALLPAELARWPLLLYPLCPPFALIPLHLDQAVFPLVELCLALTVVCAGRAQTPRQAALLALAAGALAWVAAFLSFSLLPGIVLAAVLGLLGVLRPAEAGARARLRPWLYGSALAALAFLFLCGLAYVVLRYDPVLRWRHSMVHHQQFKTWDPSTRGVLSAALLDVTELAYIVGLPLVVAFVWSCGGAVRRMIRRSATALDGLSIATAFVLTVLAFASMTVAEVARLWLFLVPLVILVAMAGIRELVPRRTFAALAGLATLELAWTLLLKAHSDFY